jgi:hypothetical protein
MLIIFVKGYSELRAKNKMCFSFFCLLTKLAFYSGEVMNLCQVVCLFCSARRGGNANTAGRVLEFEN